MEMKSVRALGALFVAALAALVVAGCGGGVPGNSVADVAGNPITLQAFNHWMYVAEKGNSEQDPGAPIIVPTDPPEFNACVAQVRKQIPALAKTPAKTIRADCNNLFNSLESQVEDFLIKSYWYQADAYKLGIHISNAQITSSLASQRAAQGLTSTTAFANFLNESGMTDQDLLFRVRVSKLYALLTTKDTKKVTAAAIAHYYATHQSQLGTPQTRNIRIIRTNTLAQANAAKAALSSGGLSASDWKTVAKKYSVDVASKNNGGLLTKVTAGTEDAALNKVAFASPVDVLEGPVHGTFGYYVVEVVEITPSNLPSLAASTTLIKQLLTNQYQTAAVTAVTAVAKKNWRAKTQCAQYYNHVADCSNYKALPTSTAATGDNGSSAAGG
jgi:foldase protein PrsA